MEELRYALSGYGKNKNNIISAGDDLDSLKNLGELLKAALDNKDLHTPEGIPYERLEITDKENGGVLWTTGSAKLDPEERRALEEKLEELTCQRSVIGLEWYPDENQINELEREIEAVSSTLMHDDNLCEQEEIEI